MSFKVVWSSGDVAWLSHAEVEGLTALYDYLEVQGFESATQLPKNLVADSDLPEVPVFSLGFADLSPTYLLIIDALRTVCFDEKFPGTDTPVAVEKTYKTEANNNRNSPPLSIRSMESPNTHPSYLAGKAVNEFMHYNIGLCNLPAGQSPDPLSHPLPVGYVSWALASQFKTDVVIPNWIPHEYAEVDGRLTIVLSEPPCTRVQSRVTASVRPTAPVSGRADSQVPSQDAQNYEFRQAVIQITMRNTGVSRNNAMPDSEYPAPRHWLLTHLLAPEGQYDGGNRGRVDYRHHPYNPRGRNRGRGTHHSPLPNHQLHTLTSKSHQNSNHTPAQSREILMKQMQSITDALSLLESSNPPASEHSHGFGSDGPALAKTAPAGSNLAKAPASLDNLFDNLCDHIKHVFMPCPGPPKDSVGSTSTSQIPSLLGADADADGDDDPDNSTPIAGPSTLINVTGNPDVDAQMDSALPLAPLL